MKLFTLLVVFVSWQSGSWASTPSMEQILNANAGATGGHYAGSEAACVLTVLLPGQNRNNDSSYGIENDWQVATEFESYPDAGWELAPNSMKFYVDSTLQNVREYAFDPATLKITSFAAVVNGVQRETCLLK